VPSGGRTSTRSASKAEPVAPEGAEPRGDDARMTEARIVDTARRLIETGGTEALSMRKLAAELGVAPTAIYWHVGGRAELLDAVLGAMIADLPPIVAQGTRPKVRLASIGHAIRQQVRANPAAHALAVELDRSADVSFPGQLALAREVSTVGLRGVEAAHAVRAILFLVGGFQLLEGNFERRSSSARTTQDVWRSVDEPGVDPLLQHELSQPADTDELFEFALDKLLESILS
jgi:TetR/AcrR family tetracycline transcriptional repressor